MQYKTIQAALQEVYGDDVDLCDVLVGNLAEDKIDGFAIRSETDERRNETNIKYIESNRIECGSIVYRLPYSIGVPR